MAEPWLTIIGIGEDGLAGLPDASRSALEQAEIVFGGPRHLSLAGVGAKGQPWPVPFDTAPVLECRGRPIAVLASGDPFRFGAGGALAEWLEPGEWRALPAPGIFSLAAARLGWRQEQTACLGLHAAPFARLRPYLAPGCRIIATLRDGAAPVALAEWLTAQGAGAMRMAVLERLGGAQERVRQTRADGFGITGIEAPVAVALCGADLPRGFGPANAPGRPEAEFAHDGQITRSPIRALTLAALAPRRGALLWDIGGGSGAVSVEWALAGGRACCIEPRPDRLANIRANIEAYGLSGIVEPIHGAAPEALAGLAEPDAVFVGGGASRELFETLWPLLPAAARLVANAVTLETEALLTDLHVRRGGSLTRIEMAEAAPLGRMRGWQAARPVVQWQVTR
ncbi:precorrin-6y C5,15-methyltransferase (decarboxylating) subunit CbiE [Paracoccus alkanivorans]|uniref:Precorrin-6y C5,15-methyltransferase (Decarboxylating) subunit CbiE n=1 Tax=Paracoccus alkanivorans TaxID=2116655 RepID=A0A3M0MDB1_9RHOB|nr:precorrin-6y C5,15-methyltransferase (decarboxylating) subunit CbiE [Paracoccus alkanivorans]RMC35325.1 precorrin-6y C5,15-methyltransferase (decarboxylating) subunit CbiE [Paracoccus alkanivorans]